MLFWKEGRTYIKKEWKMELQSKRLSRETLKIIALIAMVLDHINFFSQIHRCFSDISDDWPFLFLPTVLSRGLNFPGIEKPISFDFTF